MKGTIASVSLLILLSVSMSAEGADEKGRAAAAAVLTTLSRSATSALGGRYACIYITGARAEPPNRPGDVRVVVDGFAELPGRHAVVSLPANWDVRLKRTGKEWRAARVGISEASLADALIAARTGAERDQLLVAHPDADSTELARQLCDKGFAINTTGEYTRAESIAEMALAVARDGGGDDALARAVWLRGRTRDGQDRADEAIADYQEAMRLAVRCGDRETVAASLVGIGTLTLDKGDDAAGTATLRSALSEALAIGNDRIAATALLILGNREKNAADFVAALRLYDDSSARAERSGDLVINAAALANSGLVYDRLNNSDLGSRYLRRAIALYRKAGNVPGVIRNLRNLAAVQSEAKELEDAERTLREIDRLLVTHFDARVAAYSDLTRARIALWQNQPARAQRLSARALRASRHIDDERLTGSAAQMLANSYKAGHHYSEALPLYDEALRLAKSLNDLDTYWRERGDQAAALRRLGRTEEAKTANLDAIAVVEGISANVPRDSIDQRSFFQDARTLYREMFRLIASSDPSTALEWEEKGRARMLLALLSRGRSVPDAELTDRERGEQALVERRLREANLRLLRARTRPAVDRVQLEELTGSVKRARVEREVVISRMNRDRPELSWPRGILSRPSVADLQRSVPADGVILEYVLFDDRIWVIVVTHDHLHIVGIPAGEAMLNRKVARFVALLGGTQPGLSALAHELYDLLLKPLTPDLLRKKTICIVPDGQLWKLPFQALIADDGRYLIEHHPLFYAPSAAVLTWYESHGPDPAPRTVLAIGDPDLRVKLAKSSKSSLRSRTLSRLPDAEREARAIVALYGGNSQLLTGAAATEARFKSLAPQFRILHLATHGSFDDLQAMYSNVILAPGGTEDGLFEAREWIGLGIRAELVVLSACETGRGQAVGGEGVLGMSWALLAAGCPRAVVAQTDVPESTSELMIAFHRELAGRLKSDGTFDPRAATEALRDAQLAMLRNKRYADPFRWAGFMLIGRGW